MQPTINSGGTASPQIATGSNFSDGVRVGTNWGQNVKAVDNELSLSRATVQGMYQSTNNWGTGLLLSPIYTYSICPEQSGLYQNSGEAQPFYADIATIPSGAYSGEIPLSAPTNVKFGAAAWTATIADGSTGIQLDYPRALAVRVFQNGNIPGNLPTPVQIYVDGFDFYYQPVQVGLGNFGPGTPPWAQILDTGFYTSAFPGQGATAESITNKAIYQISKVRFVSTLPIPPGYKIGIMTADTFGLPYRYDQKRCQLLNITWGGTSELTTQFQWNSVTPVDSYNEALRPSILTNSIATLSEGDYGPQSASTQDPRGTYTPSSYANDPNGTTLLFTATAYGADMQFNQNASAGLHSAWKLGEAQKPLNRSDLFGEPQYSPSNA